MRGLTAEDWGGFCGRIGMFSIFTEIVFIKIQACIKMHQSMFKMVVFVVCRVYLNKMDLKIEIS